MSLPQIAEIKDLNNDELRQEILKTKFEGKSNIPLAVQQPVKVTRCSKQVT